MSGQPPRPNLSRTSPDADAAMSVLDAAVDAMPLDEGLRLLIQLRVSQINGCAYCLASHTTEAYAAGVDESRLATLAAWRDSPFFAAPERAALELAEAVTVPPTAIADAVWAGATAEHGEEGAIAIFWTATVMNAWNRIGAGMRMRPPHVRRT